MKCGFQLCVNVKAQTGTKMRYFSSVETTNSVVPAGNNEVMLLFHEDLLGEALNRDQHPVKIAYDTYL